MTGKKKCPGAGCENKIRSDFPMCFDCWMTVPKPLRCEIYHAYSDHQARLYEGVKGNTFRTLVDQAINLVRV